MERDHEKGSPWLQSRSQKLPEDVQCHAGIVGCTAVDPCPHLACQTFFDPVYFFWSKLFGFIFNCRFYRWFLPSVQSNQIDFLASLLSCNAPKPPTPRRQRPLPYEILLLHGRRSGRSFASPHASPRRHRTVGVEDCLVEDWVEGYTLGEGRRDSQRRSAFSHAISGTAENVHHG